mgnify:CR=1 FL=1|jgi:large subunit ribosomal protein L9|tara:strand:- start:81008 stop:81436 length:429 start_codon:yes stop_codon:yes gene_type:complete
MKVIFCTDVSGVGRKGEVKSVSSGYASNFLFPRRFAEPATPGKIRIAKLQVAQHEEEREIQKDLLGKNIDALKEAVVEIKVKANKQGHLYEGIHKEDIARALKKQKHIDLNPELIHLEHPIKEVGEHQISVGCASFTLSIVS